MRRRGVLGEDAFDEAGAGDDNIESALFGLHGLIEPVDIPEIGDIALHG